MSDGVIGNTSDFGSEESRFDSWSDNKIKENVRGLQVPSFIKIFMITTGKIVQIIDEKLQGSALFCVEVKIRNNNRIQVFIDGDQGVLIKDCVELSRYIESKLDRDTEDFELEVSSAGLDQPLKNHRQFVKNIGKTLKIRLTDGTQLSGELKSVTDKTMEVLKEASKKEKTPEQLISIPFSQVEEAKIVIKFK